MATCTSPTSCMARAPAAGRANRRSASRGSRPSSAPAITTAGGPANMPDLAPARVGAAYRWADVGDLNDDPSAGGASSTRLDWVGRIHGDGGGKKSDRKTNFLYCDGHVETKHIRDTLQPK